MPATQEAEAEESLEPRKWRLQRAEIVPLHSSLGNRGRLCLKKEKKRKEKKKKTPSTKGAWHRLNLLHWDQILGLTSSAELCEEQCVKMQHSISTHASGVLAFFKG